MKGFATMNSKIYSRPRIRLPKIFFSNGGDKSLKRKQKIAKIFIIMVIAFSTVKIVLDEMPNNELAFVAGRTATIHIEKPAK